MVKYMPVIFITSSCDHIKWHSYDVAFLRTGKDQISVGRASRPLPIFTGGIFQRSSGHHRFIETSGAPLNLNIANNVYFPPLKYPLCSMCLAVSMARGTQVLFILRRCYFSFPRAPFPRYPNTIFPFRRFCSDIRDRIILLSESTASLTEDAKKALRSEVSDLADELLALPDDEDLSKFLDSGRFAALLRRPPAGFASVELLFCLKSRPLLALQVFDWRRKQADGEIPILAEEYSKAIAIAGRTMNADLATELFCDAIAAGIHETCLYNALMSAYMYNGFIKNAVSVFEDLKRDAKCKPTIVSYNILLSVFGRSMLVDHMETVLRAIDDSQLSYTITTYNTAIAAYVTAWKWDKMESMYESMVKGSIKPDADTLLLLLKGYAHSVNIEKMEQIYDQIKEIVNNRQVKVIHAMICAYTKSSHPDRVKKVETLLKHIPEDEYRPWLNVLLIRMYAQEDSVDVMEGLISEALQQNTTVTTVGIMRSIISSYFRSNAVDQLARFIRKAENAGWRLCRSLYHCKMVMYGQQNRLGEMHKTFSPFNLQSVFTLYYDVGQPRIKQNAGIITGTNFLNVFETSEMSCELYG
ncbi:hypothetical protein Cni_G11906 [Canna indica]|uniref:Pentatricopeptide repeat-containing protein n=1 Tax=Canna indica TaxID=4628 RepID=A0AAQ3Q8J9_9LILI|nr:hypothetical protein Cni_G11906 [Canna indica]